MFDKIKYFAYHGAIYVGVSVVIILILYSAFAPKNNTRYTAPVTQNHQLENPKYAPFSCARIVVTK